MISSLNSRHAHPNEEHETEGVGSESPNPSSSHLFRLGVRYCQCSCSSFSRLRAFVLRGFGELVRGFFRFFIITTKKKGERTYYDEEFFMLSRGPRGLLLEMSVNVGRSQYALRSKVPGENCRLSL